MEDVPKILSDEGGSAFSLRGFRFQKKPPFSHTGYSSNDSPDTSSENPKVQMMEVRNRIVNPFSDSDSEVELPRKHPIVNHETTASTVRLNGFRPKNPSILEKEKQMKFLLEIFPKLETMKVHDVLSKHNFNTDAAAAELSRTYSEQQQAIYGSYSQWKDNYEKKFAARHHSDLINAQKMSFKRRAVGEPSNHNKKKKVRRRKSYDSDDSNGSNNYRDTRVFDSSDEDSDAEISDELTGDKKKVLDFFTTATLNELQLMQSCSKKKAEALVELRPFQGWIDLVTKLQSNKSLSTDLLNSAQQVLVTRNNIRHLMRRCTNLAQQMERAVAAGASVKEQPRNLSSSLKLTGYQMIGLNWLVVLHSQGVNGILADEMGLGKTIQIISFLAYLKLTNQALNTHLVIVPSSTLDNWKNEFARWCPELRVFMYYGDSKERRSFRFDLAKGMLKEFDVILTTYTMVGNSPEERKMFRVTPMHYVIFDEAHMLKNMNTQRYENLIRINAKHRILLTGTPLQNNLLELMSLLIFVMPKMFAEKTDDLRNLFQKNAKAKDDEIVPAFEREQIEQAKRIMRPFVLRRLKRDVLQDLPKKIDHVISVAMAPTQKDRYRSLVAAYQNIGNVSEPARFRGPIFTSRSQESSEPQYNGMSIMTDLRKLSNHPLLMRYHYDLDQLGEMAKLLAKDPNYKDTVVQYIVEDLKFMSDFEIHTMCQQFSCLARYQLPDNLILTSGKFLYLDRLLPELQRNGHRVLVFSQYVILLNVLEVYLNLRKYRYLRLDGSTAVSIRQDLINEYTEDKGIFIFLLSTRAGGLGINLTSADTVIIHDIDFNPYNDKQAEDRCHRMGQTRPVTVYRLISQGTIEEGMLAMNREKLKLEREITADESDNPDVKSVVRLLSSVLGVDEAKATILVSPRKKE
ncbi:SWI/SNF-related matrix-associated actin-dependent regulator of chromatin subfamily A containing DEAD/H box 1 homolog isoform X2 [Cylas formicarius]|uniref:SWI/SNF-related matrix-associated actin-dependent regulator of chromatin subfamily A containing DEAD/H box 1 homolog isoform X2 n=1 Tax=Cylas formicarius TaxID=197179 RepID=UPI002958B913|nr:SWI/SNF-related matrix-associated actin-dependent regulator of chromatin subfamily A containing DEAD/H box 1 homolog isoform X2 [Cylas formicarius]